jgi:rare lipoprotein A (peptidoglycan hydrolase)
MLAAALLTQSPPTKPVRLTASVYGTATDGYLKGNRRTASGEVYKPYAFTCAVDPRRLKEWPFGTRLIVYTLQPERRVIVRVTDTMNRRFKNAGRERIDLSRGAWNELTGNATPGLRKVYVQVFSE